MENSKSGNGLIIGLVCLILFVFGGCNALSGMFRNDNQVQMHAIDQAGFVRMIDDIANGGK